MDKVAIIVVTYNRKKLLKKNIETLLNQSYKNFDLFIIDNASTDGTYEYIKKFIDENKVKYRNTEKNIGGAGGFNYGMKLATELNYKYIWVMDDDTIPNENALEELIKADKKLNGDYGFLSSIALWKDGTACKMNRQKIYADWSEDIQYINDGLLRIYRATFVSFFIKSEVIKKEGLPIKEFFIWADDIEYTFRISKKYKCYLCERSQVIHETKNNEGSNIAKDDKERIDRYKYAYRNEVYVARKNGLKAIIRQILKIFVHIYNVIRYSKEYKLKKIGIIIGSSIKGIFFRPKIEYIKEK